MILLVSRREDGCADLVQDRLRDRGASATRFDVSDFPTELRFSAEYGFRGRAGVIRTEAGECDLTEVTSVYYRRPSPLAVDAADDRQRALLIAEARLGFGGALLALPAVWVNHPARAADAEFKPWQLAMASRCGWSVPRTIVTNDPVEVRAFSQSTDRIVAKTLSMSIRATGQGYRFEPVKLLAADAAGELIDRAGSTAHLVQEYVTKVADVRMTVVGDWACAVEIQYSGDEKFVDWRSRLGSAVLARVPVPQAVLSAAKDYLRGFGLSFGAFDIAVSPSGEWIFLECNANGAWEWLPAQLVDEIATAIADRLLAAPVR